MPNVSLHLGDCLSVMATLPANSIDAIICDPPYGLSFMGKNWDHGVPGVPFWEAALRVARPGAMLLAFGGTRTHHRLMCAIEDAGWEIRDCLMWLYGSGMPKGHNISKAIDKAAGKEREVVGRMPVGWGGLHQNRNMNDDGWAKIGSEYPEGQPITAPATPEAAQWQGFNTNLKPAWEPIIMARKPLSEPTIAANVLKHGTGGLNVDGCRIGTDEDCRRNAAGGENGLTGSSTFRIRERRASEQPERSGRWPANLLLSDDASALLDEMSGVSQSSGATKRRTTIHAGGNGKTMNTGWNGEITEVGYGDQGGASRFFKVFSPDDEPLRMAYVPKASRKDRNEGLEEMEPSGARPLGISNWQGQTNGSGKTMGASTPQRNTNPCVKPVQLMRWLVRLVTPPGGTVLDPFMGSGSTGKACMLEGFNFVGIDNEPEYLAIARARIEHARQQVAQMSLGLP